MDSEMTCTVSKQCIRKKMPAGLDLEISHHPLTMKSVVNLVIAMDRLKAGRCEATIATELREENFISFMLESILEEQHVRPRHMAPPEQFSKIRELQCSITDNQKRNLVLVQNSMKLLAVMLQGGNDSRKVHLIMSTYVNREPKPEARPVTLGIKNTKLFLSCHMDEGTPTLHLEEVQDKTTLSAINQESDMVRFLFYKHDTGVDISTLMSARYPDWYISTATDNNQAVDMCQKEASRYTTFQIRQV